ncbi:hypothetical protein GA0115235_110627 [Streptomyces sp. DpondAA-F4a]|nr:hypothetical protein GA0115235_110627 [Streptomyces sp. DpondAA-F4a]
MRRAGGSVASGRRRRPSRRPEERLRPRSRGAGRCAQHEQFARDDERVQGGGPGPAADGGCSEPVLAGDVGEVRVGEPERSGCQGDDDEASRAEHELLGVDPLRRLPFAADVGSRLGCLRGEVRGGQAGNSWGWWCGASLPSQPLQVQVSAGRQRSGRAVLAGSASVLSRFGTGRRRLRFGLRLGTACPSPGRLRYGSRPGKQDCDLRRYGEDAWDGARRIWTPSPAGCTFSGACAAVLPSAAVLLACALTCTITAGTASTATREVRVRLRRDERRRGGRSGSTAARRRGTCCACSPCAASDRPCVHCRAGCRSPAASR